jgi:hypothetical protein
MLRRTRHLFLPFSVLVCISLGLPSSLSAGQSSSAQFIFSSTMRDYVLYLVWMAFQKNNAFSRRLPDLVTEELVFVLSQKTSYEFKQLFEVVHDNLRRRNAANGGEEMLRLRAYEKLQNLVFRGAVKKSGKLYTGNSAALAAIAANVPDAAAITSNP